MTLNKILTTVFLFTCIQYASSQCLGQLIAHTQSEVDDFFATNTSQSLCYVSITGSTITNLSAFNQINSIDFLEIADVPNLNNFSGFDNIISIGQLNFGGEIPNITGFSSLNSVDKIFINNTTVNYIQGFNDLFNIHDQLIIGGNTNLISISAFNNVTVIGNVLNLANGLQIGFNPNLTSIPGLSLLTDINGPIYFGYNNLIQNLDFLNGIAYCRNGLTIESNLSLQNISGLSTISNINGTLKINSNPNLNSIQGISNIDPNSITNIIINGLPNVSVCNYPNICQYLSTNADNPANDVNGNAVGCSDLIELLNSCSLNNTIFENQKFKSFPNPVANIWTLEMPNITDVEVFNLLGQRVSFQGRFNSENVILDMANLTSGIYFVKCFSNVATYTSKVLKE